MVYTDYQVKHMADGLTFGESPRWRAGKLYVSDMTGKKLWAISDDGNKEIVKELPNQVNGSCFNDTGALIYGTMFDKQLWSFDPQTGTHEHYADMSDLMTGYTGDAVMDARGRMYVDDVGARVLHGEEPRAGRILLIEKDHREVKVAHEDVVFPNGIAIDSTGENLYVIETFAYQLNHFKIREDGTLYDRKVIWNIRDYPLAAGEEWSRFHSGDGICLDAEDGMWISMIRYRQFIRRDLNTGEITDVVSVDGEAVACTLGGQDGRTLYLVVNHVPAEGNFFENMVQRKTRCTIYTTRVRIGRGGARP